MEKYEINMNGFKQIDRFQLKISSKVVNDTITIDKMSQLLKEIQQWIFNMTAYVISCDELNNVFLNKSYTWEKGVFNIRSYKLHNRHGDDIIINIKSIELMIPTYKLEKIDI